MLGWGLRCFIGRGPFGAMTPAPWSSSPLAVSNPRRDWTLSAIFGVIGFGLGGEITYGQTVGFIVKPQTFWWGFLGIKAAIWAALAAGPMILATWTGWKRVNEPKFVKGGPNICHQGGAEPALSSASRLRPILRRDPSCCD